MKLRFETFDVIAIVAELRKSVIGYRLVNAYDVNNKTYLLKLSSSNSDDKPFLLIESGVRMHLTSFSWPKTTMPLGFTMKLRKHIKNKKISDIRQLGIDRIVDITFGFGEYAFHVLVELYGKGNIFLTDANYTILNLLRTRTDADQDVRYATREQFPVELCRPIPESLVDLKDSSSIEKLVKTINDLLENARGPWNASELTEQSQIPAVVSVLSNAFSYGTNLIEHCCFLAGLSRSKSLTVVMNAETDCPTSLFPDDCRFDYSTKIAKALREVLLYLYEMPPTNGIAPCQSAVVFGTPNPTEDGKFIKYDSYYPLRFAHLASKPGLDFPTFNKAVDEFYSSLEIRRNEVNVVQNEKSANKKLDNIKRDQEQRLRALKEEQIADNQKAHLLEMNIDLVDNVIMTLNSAIANQTSWTVLEEVLEKQKERGDDPVANCIVRLQLASNQAVLHLSDPYAEDSAEEEVVLAQDVLVDLDCTAFQNAKKYYTHRRQAEAKEQKTIAGTKTALKAAMKKAEKTRQAARGIPKLVKTRKPFWFEKFHWFISSDNYLVLGGRDAIQNENLIKRHFREHDIYVHADVRGASSVIVKARPLMACETSAEEPENVRDILPQPPMRTLIEAGQMAVALSNAWSAKVITNAWWVRHHQVSKTAPSGEYISTGSFVIRGRKNVLPLFHLTYGIGILFKLGEDSVERHRGERCIDFEAMAKENVITKGFEALSQTDVGNDANDEEMENAVSKAFANVTLNLNINRIPKTKLKIEPLAKKPNSGTIQSSKIQTSEKLKDAGPKVLKRGQRAKLKRIKQKYADQDEEERQMRLKILQGANAKLSTVHEVGKQPRIPEEVEEYVEKEEQKNEEEGTQSPNEEGKEGEQSPVESEKVADESVVALELGEDVPVDDTMGEMEAISTLENLTGQPTSEDSLLFALPICAPYDALQKFKYRAKLMPGTQKRGKITKLAIHHFTMDKTATELERHLIQGIKEEDICRAMPGSSKIVFLSESSKSFAGGTGSTVQE